MKRFFSSLIITILILQGCSLRVSIGDDPIPVTSPLPAVNPAPVVASSNFERELAVLYAKIDSLEAKLIEQKDGPPKIVYTSAPIQVVTIEKTVYTEPCVSETLPLIVEAKGVDYDHYKSNNDDVGYVRALQANINEIVTLANTAQKEQATCLKATISTPTVQVSTKVVSTKADGALPLK